MLYPFNDYSIILNLWVGLPAWVSEKPNMPDRVWSQQEEGRPGLRPWLPVSFWPHPWSALSWKYKMLANYLDTKTPHPLLPQWVGFFCKTVCTWPGEGNGTLVSCVWALWSAGRCHVRACPAPLRWMANPVVLSYASLISVKLVLGILLLLFVFKEKRS